MTDSGGALAPLGASAAVPALSVRGLTVKYINGPTAVRSVTFDLYPGAVLAVVGPNGAGKTTLLEAIAGRERRSPARILGGSVVVAGRDVTRLSVTECSKTGIAMIPDRNKVFNDLTVEEHLRLSLLRIERHRRADVRDDVLTTFPRVSRWLDREGAQLSGGERQLVALTAALCGEPSVLMIDEMSQGLSPAAVSEVVDALHRSRRGDLAVLVVEQTTAVAARVADQLVQFIRGDVAVTPPQESPDGHDHAA